MHVVLEQSTVMAYKLFKSLHAHCDAIVLPQKTQDL